jgi:hypothetical protein
MLMSQDISAFVNTWKSHYKQFLWANKMIFIFFLVFFSFKIWIKELISTANARITFASESVVSSGKCVFHVQTVKDFCQRQSDRDKIYPPTWTNKIDQIDETMVCKTLTLGNNGQWSLERQKTVKKALCVTWGNFYIVV